MASEVVVQPLKKIDARTFKEVAAYLVVSVAVLLLMMIVGLLMLLSQGKVINLSPDFFYQIMTLHGTGMVGISALGATAVMWYFLGQYVDLNRKILRANLVLSLVGVVMVLVAIFAFKFGGAWTFLYPLPAISAGMWGKMGAAIYLSGMLILGIGFLLVYLEIARAIIKGYGSLGAGLGWPQIFGGQGEYGPPAAVVASTMVVIANTVGLIAGASILMMELINLFVPAFTIDPLLAKNLIYAFGHIFANVVIYAAVIGVYEILPRYANRPWKSNRIFLIAWNFSTVFTVIIYPHHLLMDFAMPKWMLIMGQVLSYANGFPVLVVTAYGALMLIYRSGIKWDITSSMIFFSMFGWVAGVVPAIVDATIIINHVMHNTKWVPGHFHMYMGMGALTMIFGFMYYLTHTEAKEKDSLFDRLGLFLYGVFFFGLTMSFLLSGRDSAPRRWAVHMPEWVSYDRIGAWFAIVIIIAVLFFMIRFIRNINKARSYHA
ncbi:cbb3-type cytochrome c oxidase subunit I [Brevibacillus sp. SYSU BS000544]|uniref:cbb3-type cytochrome c oxidase subunit I n=1 Tax=Brevibacillus sp. SYSU BS000544 TaxID=3416443 RepID=UPI003CE5367F